MKKIMIFSGTTEGRQLSRMLCGIKLKHIVCVATNYGKAMMEDNEYADVRVGRMGAYEMSELLKEEGYGAGDVLVDATHPYAAEATANIRTAADGAGCEYIRVIREPGSTDKSETGICRYSSLKECTDALNSLAGNYISSDRILLTTGSKELHEYCTNIDDALLKNTYVRVLPSVESLEICENEGILRSNILAMQGPFTYELNRAILLQYGIKHLITKDSGRNGGYEEKLAAAGDIGVTVHVIERPVNETGLSVGEACERICGLNPCEGNDGPQPERRCILLCGCGVGAREQMTEAVKNAIGNADAVFGSDRMLADIAEETGSHTFRKRKYAYYLAKDIIPVLEANPEIHTAVVLFSGDSGFYSGARSAMKELKEWDGNADIRILPGISSASYLASKLGESYEDAEFFSLHGRMSEQNLNDLINKIRYNRKTFVLLSGADDLNALGRALKEHNKECVIHTGSNLSYDNEVIQALTPEEASEYSAQGKAELLSVLVINEDYRCNSGRFFANTECEYYPCHKGIEELNCLFCYCPLYDCKSCPGTYSIKEKDGRKVKSCIDCTFPHEPGNYDKIISIIKSGNQTQN